MHSIHCRDNRGGVSGAETNERMDAVGWGWSGLICKASINLTHGNFVVEMVWLGA